MNNDMLEAKAKYHSIKSRPLNLMEYMIFKNETSDHKSLLLKLYNRTHLDILSAEFEVRQLNESGDCIEKREYSTRDYTLPKDSQIILPKKIKLRDSCNTIEYELLNLTTYDNQWSDGMWEKSIVRTHSNQEDTSLTVKTFNHKPMPFPTHITFVVTVIFVITVIGVFMALNA